MLIDLKLIIRRPTHGLRLPDSLNHIAIRFNRCGRRPDEKQSGTEEVVEGHFGLDDAGMLVAQEPCCRHQRQMNR